MPPGVSRGWRRTLRLSLSRCNARTAIFFFFFSILTYRYRSNAVSTPLFQELRGAELRGRGERSNIKRICGRSVDFRAGCLIASRVEFFFLFGYARQIKIVKYVSYARFERIEIFFTVISPSLVQKTNSTWLVPCKVQDRVTDFFLKHKKRNRKNKKEFEISCFLRRKDQLHLGLILQF